MLRPRLSVLVLLCLAAVVTAADDYKLGPDSQEQAGVSLKAFAAAVGIPYTTLWWWRSRLRGGEEETRFVAVDVGESGKRSVEIVVGDVVVRVADGDDAAVARLVRAIASC